jgi:hypothetical protein
MNLTALRVVATVDAVNVAALAVISPPHGAAGGAGFLPALVGTLLVQRSPQRRRLARALCVVGLIPNTIGAVVAAPASRAASLYVGLGGAVIGVGYLAALRPPRRASS